MKMIVALNVVGSMIIMTELKTLKDFELLGKPEANGYDEDGYNQAQEELRQEAIKWVKKLKSTMLKEKVPVTMEFAKRIEDSLETNGKIKFIKHFFNLSEDDLK